uniref:Fibronectin type III and ankyrin repeat domains 1 n=1 Tax=Equus asinus asinus TaxID=83772 RepID=A0A8C4M5U6_EQUAS
MHTYGIIYTGYATKHVVEGLEPRTLYRFRLKVTSPSGEYEYSPVVSVSTTREPISSEHFHRAVNVNDEDLLVQILQGGNVKVDVPNKFGFTALMVAAQKGFTRLVKILISNGTDVNLKNGSGKDSLMLACYAGHLEVVKYLRRHGASWETRDLGGCTALHWAADGGHCNVIEWMLKDGCEVDAVDTGSGWTPLMRVSAVSGNQGVASLLIDAGADVNVRDKDGKTPLMVAVLNNHEELVQLLLDKGADASVKNEFGKGVLEMARVFDRQVWMFFLPLKADFVVILKLKKKYNQNLGSHSAVFVYLECGLLIRRKEKKANAKEVVSPHTWAPLTAKPSETKQKVTVEPEGGNSASWRVIYLIIYVVEDSR